MGMKALYNTTAQQGPSNLRNQRGMKSPQEAKAERAGPPTRRRRLDFSNMHESTPTLAFATGDSPNTTKLDVLAAAASEVAGRAPTPATSEHSHDPLRQLGIQPSNIQPSNVSIPNSQSGFQDTPAIHASGTEDEGDRINRLGSMCHSMPGTKRLRTQEAVFGCGHAIDLQQREALNSSISVAVPNNRAAQPLHNQADYRASTSSLRSEVENGTGLALHRQATGLLQSLEPRAFNTGRVCGAAPQNTIQPILPSASQYSNVQSRASRRLPRKSPPERLPLNLMQHKSWLMPCNHISSTNGGLDQELEDIKRKLQHCLGLRARRWALNEFLTPVIDRAFYQEGSMAEYIYNLGLHQIPKFSKADMSFIRRALGAPPRRLSGAFLKSERCALHAHRQRCRAVYEMQLPGGNAQLPAGIPAQCSVGQTVVARHPHLHTLHDGNILTVGTSTYMVQFHRSELGVGKVPDTDLAPADALDWAPTIRSQPSGVTASVLEPQEVAEMDFNLIDKLSCLTATKAKLVKELQAINDAAEEGKHKLPDGTFEESFQLKYKSKVAEVEGVNEQLAGSYHALATRVDEISTLPVVPSRPKETATPTPLTVDDAVTIAANGIVRESMVEASTLVQNLWKEKMGNIPIRSKPSVQIPKSGVGSESNCEEAHGTVLGNDDFLGVNDATGKPVEALSHIMQDNVQCRLATNAEIQDNVVESCILSLQEDDESLVHMSTKLTAMFIAIQRCAASSQDSRTIQRALIKLVADLKPASQANTAQYQLITKNVGRLSSHLGAR